MPKGEEQEVFPGLYRGLKPDTGFQWALASLQVQGKEKLTVFFVRERGVLTRYINRLRNPNRINPNPFGPPQALQTHKGVSPCALTLLEEPEALSSQNFSEAQRMDVGACPQAAESPSCVLSSVLSLPNQ